MPCGDPARTWFPVQLVIDESEMTLMLRLDRSLLKHLNQSVKEAGIWFCLCSRLVPLIEWFVKVIYWLKKKNKKDESLFVLRPMFGTKVPLPYFRLCSKNTLWPNCVLLVSIFPQITLVVIWLNACNDSKTFTARLTFCLVEELLLSCLCWPWVQLLVPVHLGVQQHDDDKVLILICRLFEVNKYKYFVDCGKNLVNFKPNLSNQSLSGWTDLGLEQRGRNF